VTQAEGSDARGALLPRTGAWPAGDFARQRPCEGVRSAGAFRPEMEKPMSKGQKSNKEVRKPKAAKAPKLNASNPSTKDKPVNMVNIK
jgi:hypothetical protein